MVEMDLNRFEALVAAYGATPGRWPDDERAAAQAFARADPHAAALLAEADTIDALLFAHRVAEPSRTLRAMVIEAGSAGSPAARDCGGVGSASRLPARAGCSQARRPPPRSSRSARTC